MKFRRMVLLFIFLLLVVAWLTKPGEEKFHKFYETELRDGSPPIIRFSDRFLFTRADVEFYQSARLDAGETLKAVSTRKDSYLGLFGRFWKL